MSLVKLQASDCDVNNTDDFKEVPLEWAKLSVTIAKMMEDIGETDSEIPLATAIPLPTVTRKILDKVMDYCEWAFQNPNLKEEEVNTWGRTYCTVDQATLFELILAANYLDIKGLLDMTCKHVAVMIKGKTPEEIRKTFNIKVCNFSHFL